MSARFLIPAVALACLGLACTDGTRSGPDPVVPRADAGTGTPEADAGTSTPEPDAGTSTPEPDAGTTNPPPPPDAGGTPDAPPTTPPPDGPPQPPPADGSMPKLGVPIDRVGRAGVSDLLTRAFDPGKRSAALDRYNSLTPKDARDTMTADLIEALRIWDGLDRNCGNQLYATPVILEERYKRLATRLLDDVLYVDSQSRDCWYYMGLETDEQATVPNNDCGGRTLTEDAIDVFYAILVNGMRGPIRDGVARDDRIHSNDTFPFVAPPGEDFAGSGLAPPPSDVAFDASDRSCKNLGYTDSGGGGGSGSFGATCGSSAHCAGETGLCVQNTCFYGGFCTETCFDGDDKTCAHLGANAACEWVAGEHACVIKCASDAECTRDGYHCGPDGYCISQP